MTYWLFQQIRAADRERSPQFALQSTLNWMKSLSFETVSEHGAAPQDQFNSCGRFFEQTFRPSTAARDLGDVFEAVFQSLTYAMALTSLADSFAVSAPWLYPGAVVSWYYAYYTAVHAMLHTHGHGRATDNHHATIGAFDGMIRSNLPHPFNMVATWQHRETYAASLPSFPAVSPSSLQALFRANRADSQGMLLEYLGGTARYEMEKLKQRVLSENHRFRDFRTRDAQALRDQRVANQLARVNFLHCAFRYRGKANYRDAIYITYGQRAIPDDTFLRDLAASARFAFICGLAYVARQVGTRTVNEFLGDLRTNTRGLANAAGSAQFWVGLTA